MWLTEEAKRNETEVEKNINMKGKRKI